MKPRWTFVNLLILALLLSSVPTTELRPTRAAELQAGGVLVTRTAGLVQDRPFTVFSDLSAPSVVQSPTSNWHTEYVDHAKYFSKMTDRSLHLDAAGHPHIAYGGKHLYYAWHDGTRWHYETVDDTYGVGDYTSLALDGAGRPHISYYDDTTGDLKYAWHDGTGWRIETVDGDGDVGLYTSLALDGADRPHISYYDYTYRDLKYAWHDGTTWQIEVADSEGGRYTSLALDGSDHPHISYYGGTAGGPKYGWHDGMDWHIETVDSQVRGTTHTSLALDGVGHPHISYYDDTNRDLKYAWHDGTVWHIEMVDSLWDTGWYISLALDGSDHPHISYYDKWSNDLKYAWYDGVAWYIETVDSNVDWWVDSSASASLALDEASRPHISYYDADDDTLKYAWRDDEAGWHTETVDICGSVGKYNSLALDGVGHPHISYYDATHKSLKYAWHNGTGWGIKTVDDNRLGYVGEYNSLALDGSDHPHISYCSSVLKYAWRDETDWHIETVGGSTCRYTSLALDGYGRPHISYNSGDNLRYAWHNGSGWQGETVDSLGEVSGSTSLALDKTGRPHISYYLCFNWHFLGGCVSGDLKYAWHDGTTWRVETVSSFGQGWSTCRSPLALDGTDRPHISYRGNGGLKYAWYDGVTWQIETVDSSGWNISLALDGLDRPYISYSDDSLKYAWQDEGVWHIETVDSVDTLGRDISLALDGAGRPHISYYDSTYRDLKYAWLRPSPFLGKQAAPADGLRNNDTLTYTLTISGPDLRVRLWDPLSPLVRYVPGSITDTIGNVSGTLVLPAAVYSPTVHAVVWEGTLPTDTVEVIRFQVTPGITGTGSLSLSLPIVNTAWLTDTYSGVGVSATVIVNGYRVYLPLVLRQSQ